MQENKSDNKKLVKDILFLKKMTPFNNVRSRASLWFLVNYLKHNNIGELYLLFKDISRINHHELTKEEKELIDGDFNYKTNFFDNVQDEFVESLLKIILKNADCELMHKIVSALNDYTFSLKRDSFSWLNDYAYSVRKTLMSIGKDNERYSNDKTYHQDYIFTLKKFKDNDDVDIYFIKTEDRSSYRLDEISLTFNTHYCNLKERVIDYLLENDIVNNCSTYPTLEYKGKSLNNQCTPITLSSSTFSLDTNNMYRRLGMVYLKASELYSIIKDDIYTDFETNRFINDLKYVCEFGDDIKYYIMFRN